VTGLYVLTLLGGGGARMPSALRPWAVLLQLAALVSFGGRTALLLTIAMAALWSVPCVIGVLRGRRSSLLVFAGIAGLIPMLALFVGLIAYNGFFDVLMDRFADDGGSANIVINSYESISNKAVGLTQFAVLMLVMFHPSHAANRTTAEAAQVRGRGLTQPFRQAKQV